MTIKDLKEFEGMYFIGNIFEVDGTGWVDKEKAERILEILNNEL